MVIFVLRVARRGDELPALVIDVLLQHPGVLAVNLHQPRELAGRGCSVVRSSTRSSPALIGPSRIVAGSISTTPSASISQAGSIGSICRARLVAN